MFQNITLAHIPSKLHLFVEVIKRDGVAKRVFDPFSIIDLSQCKQTLWRFSEDEFSDFTLTFNQNWSDLHILLCMCCTPEKKQLRWAEIQASMTPL